MLFFNNLSPSPLWGGGSERSDETGAGVACYPRTLIRLSARRPCPSITVIR